MQERSLIDRRRWKAIQRNQQARNDEEYLQYPSKEDDLNEISKVYHINTYGRFTVIVRSSFVRLRLHPTTKSHACYSCDSNNAFRSPVHGSFDASRRRKQWIMMNERTKQFIVANRKSLAQRSPPTTVIYSRMLRVSLASIGDSFDESSVEVTSMKSTHSNELSPMIVHQEHSHHGLIAFLFALTVIIVGLIIW